MGTDSALCEEGSVISYMRPRMYVVGGYETDSISRNDVKSRQIFPKTQC
jgi:hypothetical protein